MSENNLLLNGGKRRRHRSRKCRNSKKHRRTYKRRHTIKRGGRIVPFIPEVGQN